MVEEYERPAWTFNKVVYIEKEGFIRGAEGRALGRAARLHADVIEGFTTRAARDLVDKLAEHDEPVTIFCAHDADAYGTMIYQTFQEETKARGARKIRDRQSRAGTLGGDRDGSRSRGRGSRASGARPLPIMFCEREDRAPDGRVGRIGCKHTASS